MKINNGLKLISLIAVIALIAMLVIVVSFRYDTVKFVNDSDQEVSEIIIIHDSLEMSLVFENVESKSVLEARVLEIDQTKPFQVRAKIANGSEVSVLSPTSTTNQRLFTVTLDEQLNLRVDGVH